MVYNSLLRGLGIWSFFIMAVIIVVAFFIHEFSKVVIANIINPDAVAKGVPIKKFIEPIGFIFMFVCGIGWANSCKINPGYFKDRKKDTLKVYLGAVICSVVIGIILMVVGNVLRPPILSSVRMNMYMFYFANAIYTLGTVSTAVGIMNLIPMVPFSGYNIFFELSSPNTKMWLINNKSLVQMIVIFLMLFGIITSVMNVILNVLQTIVNII